MIINVVEGINFVLPGYQNGEKVRVMLRFYCFSKLLIYIIFYNF